jgi:lipopolysaccharide O-acetyltransferase
LRYSFFQSIYLGFCLLCTKILFRKSRLVRLPIDIRGRRHIDFGTGLTTGSNCRIEAYPDSPKKVLFFGVDIQINDFVHIAAKESVVIGDNVLIASKVFISDLNHGSYKGDENDSSPFEIPRFRDESSDPVVIGDNVWIGESVMILPGVEIGRGSVVGAGAVVTKSIPEFSIAVGNPARVIKTFSIDNNKWQASRYS